MARNFHFDLVAPFYDRVFSLPSQEEMLGVLRLPVCGDLLDAGGGTGRASFQMQPWVKRLILCDLSFPMLRQAKMKRSHICLQGAADHLPFPANTLERILVKDALHHFNDQAQALADLLRVLKPGGRMVIEEPDASTWQVKMLDRLEKLAGMGSHIHTPAQIQAMISAAGYTSQVQRFDKYSVWIIVDK